MRSHSCAVLTIKAPRIARNVPTVDAEVTKVESVNVAEIKDAVGQRHQRNRGRHRTQQRQGFSVGREIQRQRFPQVIHTGRVAGQIPGSLQRVNDQSARFRQHVNIGFRSRRTSLRKIKIIFRPPRGPGPSRR